MTQSPFTLVEDSATTSGAAPGVSPIPSGITGLNVAEARVDHVYWKSVELHDIVPVFRGSQQRTGRNVFFHSTIVTTATSISVVSAKSRSVDYSVHQPGTVWTRSLQLRNLELPPLASDWETTTIPGWEVVGSLPAEWASGVADIDVLISDMKGSGLIVRSQRLMNLANRAAEVPSRPQPDIEAWARKLTDDVKNASD